MVPCVVAFALSFAAPLSLDIGREGGAAALLLGPDDFMRMVQVLDWTDGQGWSDTVQRRLNPPAGVPMHWSRFADAPLAALISLGEPWFGRVGRESFFRFLAVSLVSLALNQAIVHALVDIAHRPYWQALIVVLAAVPPMTFLAMKHWGTRGAMPRRS